MKRNLILLIIFTWIAIIFYIFGAWVSNSDRREMQKKHIELLTQMKLRFENIINKPTCVYGINNPPVVGSQPKCDNIMFLRENGHKLALHSAYAELMTYDIRGGVDPAYVHQEMSQFFGNRGFILDEENTTVESVWSDEYRRYISTFVRDGLYCQLFFVSLDDRGLSDINPPHVNLACGRITDEDRRIYADFSAVARSHDNNNETFWLRRREGIFAELRVGSVSSMTFLLKQVDGVWTAPLGGSQEYPMCADVDRLGFPKSIYENCMLKDYTLRDPS